MGDVDRGYVSQYSQEDIGIVITVASVPTDPDATVTVEILNEDSQSILLIRDATRTDVGVFQITLSPAETASLGNYRATWSYLIQGEQKTFVSYFSIGGAEPAYDQLSPGFKTVVDDVWILFADLFDSPMGGPNLMTWAQSNFNRGRVAQLMKRALGILNTQAQPYQTYTLDGVGGQSFPLDKWGPLLVQATYVEVLKHLQRSYTEQPSLEGGSITRLNRERYWDRWGAILEEERDQLKDQLSIFKMSAMGLGKAPSVLVSGGAYPRYSSMYRPYGAARPRMLFANSW